MTSPPTPLPRRESHPPLQSPGRWRGEPDNLPAPGVTQGPIADVPGARGWTSVVLTGVAVGVVVALVVAAYLLWPRPATRGGERSGPGVAPTSQARMEP